MILTQIKDSIYHYLAIEKNIDYLFEDPTKIIHRTDQFREASNELLKDFILLVGSYMNKEFYVEFQITDEEIDFLIYIYQKQMLKLLNTKNYMRKLYPDIILHIILKLLILNYFKPNQVEIYFKELKLKKIDDFINRSESLISRSVENELDLEELLGFMDYLYDTVNNLEIIN